MEINKPNAQCLFLIARTVLTPDTRPDAVARSPFSKSTFSGGRGVSDPGIIGPEGRGLTEKRDEAAKFAHQQRCTFKAKIVEKKARVGPDKCPQPGLAERLHTE